MCGSSSVGRLIIADEVTSRIGSGAPQGMTRRTRLSDEKGYFSKSVCTIRRGETRTLNSPAGTRQPAPGDAISSRLASIAEVQLGEDALHVILDRMLANHQTLGDLGIREA